MSRAKLDELKKNGANRRTNAPKRTKKNNSENFEELEKLKSEIENLKDENKSLLEEKENLANEKVEKDEKLEEQKTKIDTLLREISFLQKQNELDVVTAQKKAKKNLAENILDFLNTLHISFTYLPETEDEKIQKFLTTLSGSFSKLQNDLKNVNLEMIIPREGDEFNAENMQILENSSGEDHPKIKHVVSIGLKIDDQLVKPAVVIA
jgi:molecular chaperone GrpE (heat shock protein)